MKKLLVYSHDTYGLGNLRRMVAISHYLSEAIPDLSILLISGSPMIHSFRLRHGIDYIKLPCLTRTERDGYRAKFLDLGLNEAVKLRSELILSAMVNFKPDLVLVDKKPFGVKNELRAALTFAQSHLPETRHALILRDILDAPDVTAAIWQRQGYFDVIESYYDRVLVLGTPEVFDPRREYRFPSSLAQKVEFCGYLRRNPGARSSAEVRGELQLAETDRLVVVTPGGGEDGYQLVSSYVAGLPLLPPTVHSLIISGPEMQPAQRQSLAELVAAHPQVTLIEFTDDLMSYLNAADVVISMGGYNTVCEILTLQKRAIVVPRVRPVQEQLIRAEQMSRHGQFKFIHPDQLTSTGLIGLVLAELSPSAVPKPAPLRLDAHLKLAGSVAALLAASATPGTQAVGLTDGREVCR